MAMRDGEIDSDCWTLGQCASLACLLEATAPKPGNVHRGADFDDLTFPDLVVSAVLIGPAMEQARDQGIGRTILEAVRATRRCVASNANLGIILLLAPLASVPVPEPLRSGVAESLARMTPSDAASVYQAIRLARPGGMGVQPQMDIAGAPPTDLLSAMKHAQSRDFIARQYSNGFQDVFDSVVPWLHAGVAAGWSLTEAIVHTHVRMMAEYPDSLIARKCGVEVARQAQQRAARTLAAGRPGEENYGAALADLDFWLRSDGQRRNPGTTADLVAAGLFVGLRDRTLQPPWR